jgi:type II secretory pathway pseudopilin PulG
VAIALVMIALSVVVTDAAFELRREREVESQRRANQYVRAIREYYLKFQRYPGSVDQLENTNNIRFLRQRYIDPLTGKADYRLIIVGQNKTTPKGFFGAPLSGLPGAGPGAGPGGLSGLGGSGAAGATPAAGAAGAAANGAATMGFGNSGGAASGFATGAGGGLGTIGPGMGPTSSAGGGQSTGPGAGTGTGPGTGSSPTGSGGPGSNLGPIMGVGSSATGNSILTVNEQTSYETWEFLYDPRVERLKAAAALNSGVQSGSGFGGNPAGLGGGATTPAAGGAPGTNGGATTPAGGTQPTQR